MRAKTTSCCSFEIGKSSGFDQHSELNLKTQLCVICLLVVFEKSNFAAN